MRVITGKAKGHTLKGPPNSLTRPMLDRMKEALFGVLNGYGPIRGRVLDLFAGTGSLGIECLSRGAEWADFVEQRGAVCRVIAENLAHTHFTEQARIHCMPVARFVSSTQVPATYDIIFMDPPYADPQIEATVQLVADSALSAPGTLLVVGHWPRIELAETYGAFERIKFRRLGDSCFSIYERSA